MNPISWNKQWREFDSKEFDPTGYAAKFYAPDAISVLERERWKYFETTGGLVADMLQSPLELSLNIGLLRWDFPWIQKQLELCDQMVERAFRDQTFGIRRKPEEIGLHQMGLGITYRTKAYIAALRKNLEPNAQDLVEASKGFMAYLADLAPREYSGPDKAFPLSAMRTALVARDFEFAHVIGESKFNSRGCEKQRKLYKRLAKSLAKNPTAPLSDDDAGFFKEIFDILRRPERAHLERDFGEDFWDKHGILRFELAILYDRHVLGNEAFDRQHLFDLITA